MAYNLLLNHKVSIVKFSDLLKNIKSEFKTSGNETYNLLLDSEILIIDGLGNEAITTWSRDEILLSLEANKVNTNTDVLRKNEVKMPSWVDEVKKIDPLAMSPLEALNFLYDLKRKMGDK